jgi:hypothetical protein
VGPRVGLDALDKRKSVPPAGNSITKACLLSYNKYIHTYMRTYTHTYIKTYIYMRSHLHTYIHIHIHAYVRTYIHTYVIQTHTHTHTYIYTHTYTHTHACLCSEQSECNASYILSSYVPFSVNNTTSLKSLNIPNHTGY